MEDVSPGLACFCIDDIAYLVVSEEVRSCCETTFLPFGCAEELAFEQLVQGREPFNLFYARHLAQVSKSEVLTEDGSGSEQGKSSRAKLKQPRADDLTHARSEYAMQSGLIVYRPYDIDPSLSTLIQPWYKHFLFQQCL